MCRRSCGLKQCVTNMVWLVLCFAVACRPSYASSSTAYLTVSCSVVKSGKVSLGPVNTNVQSSIAAGGNSLQIAGVNVSCPKDVPISVSYSYSADCDNKYGVIGRDKPPDITFYKDAACTEVWKPGQSDSYCSMDKNTQITKSIYCKTNKDNIQLLKGQSAVIFTIRLEY